MNLYAVLCSIAESAALSHTSWEGTFYVVAEDPEGAIAMVHEVFNEPIPNRVYRTCGGRNFGPGEIIVKGYKLIKIRSIELFADHLIMPKEK